MRNLWQETALEVADYLPLEGEASADLVIIGGGFTGCSAALHAAGQGASVRLIEAETIGHGGSGRNVGLVNAGLWMPPEKVCAVLGKEAGGKLNAVLAGAPDLVFSLIEAHGVDCEAKRAGTLHCAHSPSGFRDLQDRFRQLQDLGAPVTLLDAEETAARTGSTAFHGALHDARAGTIQPLSYCRGLARAAAEAGAHLHERSPAVSVAADGEGWRVATPSGAIRAGSLIMATNAYHLAATGLPEPETVPVGYFQMATRPLTDNLRRTILPGGEGCWDTAQVMSSFRTDNAGRLIIGAVGSLDHAGGGLHRGWTARKLAALFPHLKGEIFEQAWFGRIAMTSDKLPRILRLGESGYAIFGYSGRGIAPGTLFGKSAVVAIIERNPDLLPVAAIEAHKEFMPAMRAHFYETGATLVHALAVRTRLF
jgi:glycine/D-amino acid oxidase-like deaminating enzyme